MKTFLRLILVSVVLTTSSFAGVIKNGSFEDGLAGWRPLWTREADAGTLTLESQFVHSGKKSVRIEYRGARDWSFEPDTRVPVNPGELFELTAWVKLTGQGGGSATLCVSTWDMRGKVQQWSYAARSIREAGDWQRLFARFIIPPDCVRLQPRLIGNGPATVWADDFSLEKKAVDFVRKKDLPETLTLTNAAIAVTLDTANATFGVVDRRTGRHFQQKSAAPEMILTDATVAGDRINLSLVHAVSGLEVKATARLEVDLPEFIFEFNAQGELPAPIQFPCPFLSGSGEYLLIPINEGISYPVDDKSINPMRLIAYGGHGICMAFWGVTDGERGQMAIIESPDDAAIQIGRNEGRLTVAPEWDSQRGQFGYARRLRYVFFDKGGHVAMAKRYRAYARKIGLFKTLEQKRKENPNVDLLVGAVNVWCWDKDPVGIVKEMQSAGIEHILWSSSQPPEKLKALNGLGVLTSRYDIYQDVMNPKEFGLLKWIHSDWPTEAWPKDIITDEHGDWLRGWGVEGKDDKLHPCGVICDTRAPEYARKRIPADLATHPYRCRFIDTTTAAPWHECYDPSHPMTRTDSRQAKMELLRYVSEDCKLVTGCETGHDAAVPFLHYFEGMLSLGPYRVPDAGRNMDRIWNEVPETVAKFQLGQQYRLPLWELVYHDCVVAQWYWGDYNNKLPTLWDKRDLFNVLYGTPPMFMFSRDLWNKNKARFVQSYKNTCPHVRRAGYSEMTDHRFLTPDRNVQQTAFANGMTVTVNFGDTPYRMSDGGTVVPAGFRVSDGTK